MKKKIIGVILSLSIMLTATSTLTASAAIQAKPLVVTTQAASDYDFRNIKWGMSDVAVIASEKQVASYTSRYGAVYNDFYYTGSKLYYCFTPITDKVDSPLICNSATLALPSNYSFNDVYQDYTKAFGNAVYNGYVYTWDVGSTRIILFMSVDNAGVQYPQVSYSKYIV